MRLLLANVFISVSSLLLLFFFGPVWKTVHAVDISRFSCALCINNSSAYTTIAQCVFNPGPSVCSQTDINNDGRTDAGDLSACGFCQENQTNTVSDISPTSIPTPIVTLTPTFTPTPTPTYIVPVFACSYCLTVGDPYTSIGQCIFNEALPQCTDAMDINQDGILDAGDLTACTRCKAEVSVEPTRVSEPSNTPVLTSALSSPTQMVTVAKEPCAKKNRGDTDCIEDRFNKSVNILDYAIWYTEFIKGCSAENAANCGADEDGDGTLMDANFNYPGSGFEKTDTVVNLFDYAVWIQGLLVENNI